MIKQLFASYWLLFVCIISSYSQNQITISGHVRDSANGEWLIGTAIELINGSIGTISNEYGFYSLSVPSGILIQLRYSYIGFEDYDVHQIFAKDTTLHVNLRSANLQLETVVVEANSFREQINTTEMSITSITTRDAKLLPALLGEVDIIKTIQLKPGISSGSEGSSGLIVRGGSTDQNLIVLDDALVYNANHLFGFFSTFNADAVKDVKIYKGGFPAQYGGRLSSVIDVKLKEGNRNQFQGSGGLGIISSRLTLEGPIVNDRSSFMVSGRRTYVDLITNRINKSNEENQDFSPIPAYSFYDLNTKINFQLGEKDHIYLSGYFGRDVFNFKDDNFDFNFNWGNSTGTVRWNHQFTNKLFSNTTFTFSDYQYNIANVLTGFSFRLGSDIRDISLKTDFYYAVKNGQILRAGLHLINHKFTVGRLKAGSDDGAVSFSAGHELRGQELAAYISNEQDISNRFKISTGLRFSGFLNDGRFNLGVEPRLGSRLSISDQLSVKLSYARMYQYVHLVSNSGIALPTDVWYPSTKRVKPQISDQVALGYSFLLGDRWLLTNEYFYKKLNRQIEFRDHARLFANDNLEEEFVFGEGYGYGMEIGLEKNQGKFTGWLGYTLAWVKKGRFPDIMDGRFFPPSYDRRHDLSLVWIYRLNRKFFFTATYVFGSGDISWLPSGKFILQDIRGSESKALVPVYEDRNTFRLPSYHRMDLGMVINFFPRWGHHDMTLSVYNLFDRRNPYFIYLDAEVEIINQSGIFLDFPREIVAKQVSLFPILPSITWNFKF